MPAQKKTNLGLNQWIGSEYPKRIDFVEDNKIINDELEERVKYTDISTEDRAGKKKKKRVKEISPKPDLTPYVPFSKGYRAKDGTTEFVRTNGEITWASPVIEMFNASNAYTGSFYTDGWRAYYKVPNRNGGNWCEIMDNHDMTVRDVKLNHLQGLNPNNRRIEDIFFWHVREIRMAGYVEDGVNGKVERNGYVLTKVSRNHGDVQDNIKIGSRALQFLRNGQWLNAYFV